MSGWITVMSWIETLVLLVLIGLSIWSVSIMVDRRRRFAQAHLSFDRDKVLGWIRTEKWDELRKWTSSTPGILSGALKEALDVAPDVQKIEKAVASFLQKEHSELEKGLTVLATLGSNAPFIGLFGTVLGIIRAFAALAESGAGTDSVMGAISSALIATATGLLVAIPAVIAFNYFSERLRALLSDCEGVRDLMISRLKPGAF